MKIARVVLIFLILSSQSAYASGILKVAFLDIGQGDAIYIEAPNGRQMIVDGGPGSAILRPLGSVMPWGDRTIDVILVTNPDADHMSGFIDVLKNYAVGAVVEPGTHSDTATYKALENAVDREAAPHVLVRRGDRIVLDESAGVKFDVLFPDRDVSDWSRNDGSIVGRLVYGNTSVMLMGDATKKTEGIILSENPPTFLKSDILKLGHHGSKTSSGEMWLRAVAPKEAVISAGCHNRYGHPHKEVIDRLTALSIDSLRTCGGTIVCESDGINFECRKK